MHLESVEHHAILNISQHRYTDANTRRHRHIHAIPDRRSAILAQYCYVKWHRKGHVNCELWYLNEESISGCHDL
jgi:hypothetical protein